MLPSELMPLAQIPTPRFLKYFKHLIEVEMLFCHQHFLDGRVLGDSFYNIKIGGWAGGGWQQPPLRLLRL